MLLILVISFPYKHEEAKQASLATVGYDLTFQL